ncbi:MAG: FtsB family cell division protein [Rickettsiales bacterium]
MIITKYTLYNFVRRHRINKLAFISYGVAISLMIYFMMVSIFSDKGLIEYYSLKKQAQKIELEKLELQNKIRVKKDLIKGMNYESLDLDLVDEQSRKILGYVGKDELVIYQDQEHKPNKK